LNQYEFIHPKTEKVDKGRLFVGEILKTTGVEISFRELAPKTTIPFLHKHFQHEEIYVFLKGKGNFQVDDDVFDVSEGSLVLVTPDGNRTLSNTLDKEMVYMVIQGTAGSLDAYNIMDVYMEQGEIKL